MGAIYSYFFPEENQREEGASGIAPGSTTSTKSETRQESGTASDQNGGESWPLETTKQERALADAFVQDYGHPDNLKNVDKMTIIVKAKGKCLSIDVFPLEKISVLKLNACEQAGMPNKKTYLVYEGDIMDEDKTVQDYRLRGGKEVNLIYAA